MEGNFKCGRFKLSGFFILGCIWELKEEFYFRFFA